MKRQNGQSLFTAAGIKKEPYRTRRKIMGWRWERYGDEWIKSRFVSGQDNIFITEAEGNGLRLYWFDDGPEIPTDSVEIGEDEIAEFENRLSALALLGDQAVCEYLAEYFPDLRKYWLDEYGSI
jgi:hypothetical protein